jgi:O-antigen/teichoic acid export membrane protein
MLVIGQIASTLITAIGIIIVARLLGSTTYGDITISIARAHYTLTKYDNS